MHRIVDLDRWDKRRLRVLIRRERVAAARTRMLIVLHLARGRSPTHVARDLHIARSTVYRVAERFNRWGFAAFADRREDNGRRAVGEMFLLILRRVAAGCPQDFGYARPTWTQELLCLVMQQQTGVRVSQPTMSRCLKRIGARLGRPRPVLPSVWPESRQKRRIRAIRRLIERLPADEVAVYADEVDIHLNPKIGFDWMLPGQQKRLVTPGKNVKRYLAGALDARSGRLCWVAAPHKRSALFIELLRALCRRYRHARRIHVIVDNYSIHSSRQTSLALAQMPQIRLHFLPPYAAAFNPIERVWLDLHAEVTRNHRCTTIEELMEEVNHYLKYRNRHKQSTASTRVA